jgi:hypothetical protein
VSESASGPAVSAAAEAVSRGVRWLTPEDTTVFSGTFSLLHCAVKGDAVYRAVFAVRLFPISHPDSFISLRHTGLDEKDREIGVIHQLSAFPEDAQVLIRESLAKQYYEQIITRVYSLEFGYGLLFFDVQTQRGREQFTMPWSGDRAEDFGATGKVLHETLGNRYVVPDVSALPPADRRLFTSFIYW